MYMIGFTSFVQERGKFACLNLFFKAWTLDHTYKAAFACIGVVLLGIVVETLSAVRRRVFSDMEPSHGRNGLLVLLHASQTCLGYFLMLAAMTYNVEIFCMVLLGIGIGHYCFNIDEPPHASTDPCCPQISETELIEQPDVKEYGTYQHLSEL